MFVQLAPELLQSCRWWLYELGLFVHDPFEVVKVWPCIA